MEGNHQARVGLQGGTGTAVRAGGWASDALTPPQSPSPERLPPCPVLEEPGTALTGKEDGGRPTGQVLKGLGAQRQ